MLAGSTTLPFAKIREGAEIFLPDVALYSRPGPAWKTKRNARPACAKNSRESLARSGGHGGASSDIFSLFEIDGAAGAGRTRLKDLANGGTLDVMDKGLAASARRGQQIAGRFIDAGPWHIGFGIVVGLCKSEVAAILLVLNHSGSGVELRESLHELIYRCRLHRRSLVQCAMAPILSVVAFGVDASDESLESLSRYGEAVENLR
jgi:hypothetical protein